MIRCEERKKRDGRKEDVGRGDKLEREKREERGKMNKGIRNE